MSFKHPQYLTPNGYTRQSTKPKLKKSTKGAPKTKKEELLENKEIILSTKVAQRVIRKRKLAQQQANGGRRTLSPQAAKALAEALKGMLHS